MAEKFIQYLTIKKSKFFDKNFYLKNNPDLGDLKINPLMHFINQGWKENRDPGPEFSTYWYLKTYSDVKNAGINPLFHYLKYGRKEGRRIKGLPKTDYSQPPRLVKNKPVDFLIIGAQRAGTTSLFRFLDSLPPFSGSREKELGFFSLDKRYKKGASWYHQQFEICYHNQLRFEATPEYLYYPFVPTRVRNYKEDLKFIVILRDPVERCFSAWKLFRSLHKFDQASKFNVIKEANKDEREGLGNLLMSPEYPTFERAVQDDLDRYHNESKVLEPSFVRRGLYHKQITTWFEYFDKSKFLFLDKNDLRDSKQLSNQLKEFFCLEYEFSTENQEMPEYNRLQGKISAEASKAAVNRLREFYCDHNRQLFELLGRNFNWDGKI